jgi:hypothetical protein
MVSTNQLVGTMILQVWNLPSKKTGSEIGDEHRADAWWMEKHQIPYANHGAGIFINMCF